MAALFFSPQKRNRNRRSVSDCVCQGRFRKQLLLLSPFKCASVLVVAMLLHPQLVRPKCCVTTRVSCFTVRFFFLELAASCCVHVFGSCAMVQHLLPERVPLRKLRKNMFWGKNACERDRSRSIRCPFWGVSRYELAPVGALCTPHLAFEPKVDQIGAGLTAVAWCVVLLPHNWRWDEHRSNVAAPKQCTQQKRPVPKNNAPKSAQHLVLVSARGLLTNVDGSALVTCPVTPVTAPLSATPCTSPE